MNEQIFPTNSATAYSGYQILLSQSEDIIIYVEDNKGIHIYENLFERLFDKELKVNHIVPVAGKINMEIIYDSMLEENEIEGVKPAYFIADLDFDDLLQKKKIEASNFHYLERYSIENYLVDEKSGSNFLNYRLNIGKDLCKDKVSFDTWLDNTKIDFEKLILIFATIQKLDIGIKNCKYSIERFLINNAHHKLDNEKIKKYLKNEVYPKYKEKKVYGFVKEYFALKRRLYDIYDKEIWRLIPGKQLLHVYMQYLTSLSGNKNNPEKDGFVNAASLVCDLNELNNIKVGIMKYLQESRKV